MVNFRLPCLIAGCLLFVSNTFAADDGFSRMQTLNDYIVAFDNNHSLAIDEYVITLYTHDVCQIHLANYISDGKRRKIEEQRYEGATLEEAVKKSENPDNELPLAGKYVWTETRMYEGFGTGLTTSVSSRVIDNPAHSFNGDPLQPFRTFRNYPKRIKDILSKPEYAQANGLKDAASADGKQVKELYIIEKEGNGETFERFYFSPDQKIAWPLLAEYGFRLKNKDITTCRIQIDVNGGSPIGYMGYSIEYFTMDEQFNKAAIALDEQSKKGGKIDLSKMPDPKPVTQTKTQVLFKKSPVINRPVSEEEFDFLVDRRNDPAEAGMDSPNFTVIRKTEKGIVVRPK